jgi:hypothetical protein
LQTNRFLLLWQNHQVSTNQAIFLETQKQLDKEEARTPNCLLLAEMAGKRDIGAKEAENWQKCGLLARFFAEKVTKYNMKG